MYKTCLAYIGCVGLDWIGWLGFVIYPSVVVVAAAVGTISGSHSFLDEKGLFILVLLHVDSFSI